MDKILSIYEIPLLNNIGTLVGIIIKASDLSEHSSKGYILYTFDSHLDYIIQDGHIKNSISVNYFHSPLLLHSLPKLKGKDKWNLIKTLDLNIYKFDVPVFKKDDNRFYSNENFNSEDTFVIIKDLNIKNWEYRTYHEIENLGLWMHYSPDYITLKLSIKWLANKNFELKDYFDEKEMDNFDFKFAKKQISRNL